MIPAQKEPTIDMRVVDLFGLISALEGQTDHEIARMAALANRAKEDPNFGQLLDSLLKVTHAR